MSDLVKTAENEIIRNEILKMCDMGGSQGVSEQVIKAGLAKLGLQLNIEQVDKQVRYLEGKGLVAVNKIGNERLGIDRSIVSLTSKGTDVLEGNEETVGIGTD